MADGAEDKIAACDDAVMPEDAKPAMRCLRVMEDICPQDTGAAATCANCGACMVASRCGRNPERERNGLIERESSRGRELHPGGLLRKAWRSDQKAKLGILSARDTDQLSGALRSLPIWPLMALEVNLLGRVIHP
jgi:muconolactone delta-isomerase